METAPAILELGLVLLAAAGLGVAARRLGLPAVVGYLVLGIAISPFTPGFVANREQIQLLADVGVVLLLFEVGIEVDLASLRREHGGLIWAAPLQVVLTTSIAGGAALLAGVAPVPAAILGLCVALSSSVVIVNITRSRNRTTDPPTEQALLGWSVLQDLTGVILAALLLVALGSSDRPAAVLFAGLLAFVALALAAAWLLPRILAQLVDRSDSFLVVSVASGLVIAGVGAVAFDLPIALAAFVGGIVISESPTTVELRRQLVPFRELLAVLFFVTIGMLLDPHDLVAGLPWLGLFLGLLVVAKVGVVWILARIALPAGRSLQLAVGLGQMGEFSFVLATFLLAADAISGAVYAALVASVAISIGLSAVVVRLPRLSAARPT
ncbi:MAG: cation:proton antiporter [Candidatus Limnocylindrales bacterium]